MPTISVVLATYNGGAFLRGQLQSLADQVRPPDELVVGDDGSTDDTLDILNAFADQVTFPVKVTSHGGLGAHDNFLSTCDEAAGDLLAFCDQDDVWLPDKLGTIEATFNRYGADLVTHNATPVDDQLNPIRTGYRGNVPRLTFEPPLSCNAWRQMAGHAMVFRKNLLDGADWRERPNAQWQIEPIGHDELINIIAAACGLTVRIPNRLVLYRQHGANVAGAGTVIPQGRLASGSYGAYAEHRVTVAKEWAEYLKPLVPPERRPYVDEFYDTAAGAQGRRAEQLDASIPAAAAKLIGNATSGDYRSNTVDGLGWRALLRDAFHLTRRMARR